MGALPDDFAVTLGRVLEPGHAAAAAEIIEAAAALDDRRLELFLRMFAGRVRASGAPVRSDELHAMLRRAASAGDP
ncbi:MAG TPA: hypothetical protein VGG90_12620 [Candidatus Dormibacteraeota bacterium]|jgi:hypothetical protein